MWHHTCIRINLNSPRLCFPIYVQLRSGLNQQVQCGMSKLRSQQVQCVMHIEIWTTMDKMNPELHYLLMKSYWCVDLGSLASWTEPSGTERHCYIAGDYITCVKSWTWLKLKVKHGNLKCMGIMQDNLRHPYILSTTLLSNQERYFLHSYCICKGFLHA